MRNHPHAAQQARPRCDRTGVIPRARSNHGEIPTRRALPQPSRQPNVLHRRRLAIAQEPALYAAHLRGAIAQLGERLNGIQEVAGSTPVGSTSEIKHRQDGFSVSMRRAAARTCG